MTHAAPEPHAVVSERHRALLAEAERSVEQALLEVKRGEAEDEDTAFQVACHVRRAASSVGRLTGRVYSEELLDEIFSRFCIGK